MIENRITFAYVVGVEGVGHHAVAPILARIGESCGQRVVYEHKVFRRMHHDRDADSFRSILEETKHAGNSSREVFVVEDSTIPAGNSPRTSTFTDRKSEGQYDIEWVFDQVTKVGGIDMKVIFLNRDFYRTVASHSAQYGGFEQHARVVNESLWYIHSEFDRIHTKDPNSWRQVRYEWFTELTNCQKLVESLATFLGMQHCHVELACEKVRKHVHAERVIVANETEVEIARGYGASVPIPLLEF